MRRPTKQTGLATLYLASIPIFALIYNCLPRGFYYPYARHESAYAQATTELQAELTAAFINDITRTWPGGEIKEHPEQVNVENVKALDDGRVALTVFITWRTMILENNGYLKNLVKIDLIGQRNASSKINDTYGLNFQVSPESKSNPFPNGGESFFGKFTADHPDTLWKFFAMVQLKPEVYEHWTSWCDAHAGFPEHIQGKFGRMLYLSAITITTVGYGDIVPLTSSARFFTGLEAILGIVIIGLFVNSIASDKRKP